MIAIAIICLAVIASTSSQQVSQTSEYNGPAADIINSPGFRRFLAMNGLKPPENFNPDESSSPKTLSAEGLESIQKRLNASREELYQSVDSYLTEVATEFRNYIINYLENTNSFIEQNLYDIGNITIKTVDKILQDKSNSFVSSLMIVSDSVLEDYNRKAAAITEKLERKLAELNRRAEVALGRGNNGVTTEQPTHSGPGGVIDVNSNKINLLSADRSKNQLHLPDY